MKKAIFFLLVMLAITAACFAQTATVRDVNSVKQSVYTRAGTDAAIKNATTPLATTTSVNTAITNASTAANKFATDKDAELEKRMKAYCDTAVAALEKKLQQDYNSKFLLLPKPQWIKPGTGINFVIKKDTIIINRQ